MDDKKIVQLYWERYEQAIVESSNKYGTYCNSIAHNILFNWADAEDLSKAEHAAMIEIDEHGVTGAAYTELALTEGAAQPDETIDFVVDRPFMFIVTGKDGSMLFAGIVKNID